MAIQLNPDERISGLLANAEKRLENILSDKLIKIILYGSYASGNFDAQSDVDIMALTSLKDEDIYLYKDNITDLSAELSFEYGIFVSILIKNYQKYNYYSEYVPFYSAIAREGIVIHG